MRLLILTSLFVMIPVTVSAQPECPQAPVLEKSNGENIFNDRQETDLGEIIAEAEAQNTRILEEEDLIAPLRRIGERVIRQMPQSNLKHRFFLIDEPTANAYAFPGGRIYVTRKLVTSCRSEDELAGVLAHEIGHQLKHDSAILLTEQFKKWLEITSMGDRRDIEDKYHQLLDSYRKNYRSISVDSDREQLDADQVALFAVARAGYNPQAIVDFWDRFTERKGRKGNWLSDVFMNTAPETKRLREFANTISQIPAACREQLQPSSGKDFEKWKDTLQQYRGFGKKPDIPGLLKKVTLEPSLQGEFNHLLFSPDGRYLLAQDEASIFVLQREPLQVLFRIEARDAEPGHFTPDSGFVVFHNAALRVHKYSIAEQREVEVNEVYIYLGCMRSLLSPDGSVLACFRPDPDNFIPVGVRLIDVATGELIHDKDNFITASVSDYRAWYIYIMLTEDNGNAVTMDFSADGRYFLAGLSNYKWGYDLKEKKELKLAGSVKKIMETSFAFLGSDRLVGVDGKRGDDSKIVRVPGGEVLQSGIPLGPVTLQAAMAGDFVIVRPLIETPAGIMDLRENKVFLASKTEALDIYDGTWVDERTNGEVALYRRPLTKPLAAVMLPRSPLGFMRSCVFSPDLNLLAVSDRTRGRFWDFSQGVTSALGAFRGAYFDNGSILINFAPPNLFRKLRTEGMSEKEMREEENMQQGNTIARIDLVKPALTEGPRYRKWQKVCQIGSTYALLLPKKPAESRSKDVTLEMHDFRSGKMLWSRVFKRMPALGWNPTEDILILAWELTAPGAKNEIRQDPEAARLVEDISQKDDSYFVAALDARSGEPIARFPIDTGKGSYNIIDYHPAGKYLLFPDSSYRVLVYNLKGERVGRFFGRNPTVSAKTGILAVEREPGRIALYDISTGNRQRELTFDADVEYAQFSADGRRLAVLTRNQDVYFIDVSDLTP